MSAITTVFQMQLSVPNSSLNTTPINDVPAVNTQPSTNVWYMPQFQVGPGSTTIPIPAEIPAVQTVYIKNLDGSNLLIFEFTTIGGGGQTIQLPPGCVFLYFNPETTNGGGMNTLSLSTGSSPQSSAEVFVGY